MNIHGTASHSIEYKNDRYFTYRKRIIIDGIKRESKWVKTGEFKTIDEAMKEIWCGNLPEPLDKVMQERWKKVSELAAVLFALRSLYTWNGTKWVEGQSAKNED